MLLPLLTNGHILKRYKRFLADVELADGSVVTAHCPNTGSMRGCWEPGALVQISHSDNPRRKLAWTLERVDMGTGWIGVHTGRTNPVISEALREGLIPGLEGYRDVRTEVTFEAPGFPRSRFDMFLSNGPAADVWVEVKNVTLWEGGESLSFPDAVTARGLKHLELLAEACSQGYRGVMIYALNRPEGTCFRPADEIDPVYGKTLRRVVEAGVEVVAVRILHLPQAMKVGDPVAVDLS
ncbi:MAG: DNA/RNA nuclease SfsA [gamma proteobacterium endosymbiont of Lamellibrachia anaximandri]|nr:DNA/RNA nuclease SfsA [gamma proteobacterium endosymbiont of Lamellibrachia anaximandri]